MKIAIVGTAPSTCRKAPYSDPSWKIWGCSPGLYPVAPRTDAWFELHRWEPPVIGRPDQQKAWFSPEYVMWLSMYQGPVYMQEPVREVPNSRALPVKDLLLKYGHYFFTSSIAWMMAMAIEEIERAREKREPGSPEVDALGLFGVDMSATEEYGYQRAGCQFFLQIAHSRNIQIAVPMESDITCPAPLYGISEGTHRAIKFLERERELQARLHAAEQAAQAAQMQAAFLKGALDDNLYHRGTWLHEGEVHGADFPGVMRGQHIYDDPAAVQAFGETEKP